MSTYTIVRFGCAGIICLAALAAGCQPKGGDVPVPTVVAPVSSDPGEIELSEPKVTLVEPKLVQFEIHYKFTKGQPDKFYSCDLSFPGTSNVGVRRMESWELKPEGVIRDRIVLSKEGAKMFEIVVSESPSPREHYKKISNVAKGSVQ
ncbi:hypothetical protein [Fimbriiglobus ruber]|uniref:Lipoprotein n=1 Tax=Fimbriiglobus ruber TaxID=1908690 RepID=A0A225DUF6_9BACT|nr:hypothetical protein [Fimbriiglobus ruber]OWK45150.1 hypothetical protein FRUB_01481 [Fimbriiglobus ruber]